MNQEPNEMYTPNAMQQPYAMYQPNWYQNTNYPPSPLMGAQLPGLLANPPGGRWTASNRVW